MPAPRIPADESARLNTLRSLKILNTLPEERFDRLTRLAKRLFGMPIVLISLIGEKRQWVKSAQGLEMAETSRDISFCGHAILDDGILIIEDANLDARFADNPQVTGEPGIRFYAGAPLSAPNGSKLGTLCLIDRQPRVLNDEDRRLLLDLAKIAEQEIAATQLATTDPLTLISNRRGFTSLAQYSLNSCRRYAGTAALFFFNLNLFKRINDRFGHAEGDRALLGFAGALKDTFRDSDVVGRLGGDEFVVLVTHVDQTGAAEVLVRLDRAMAKYNQDSKRGYELSYSVGVAPFQTLLHESVDELIKDAAELMVLQKKRRSQNI